jgi:hypothetical protein
MNTIKQFSGHSLTKSQKKITSGEPELQSSEYLVLFLDPKLPNKSAVRFVYDEIRLTNFSFPHFWNFEYVVIFQIQKCLTKVPSNLFYGEIC